MTILVGAAESNRGQFLYLDEVTFRTTPASGVVKTMRITSSSVNAKKQTKVSDEIRADRMVSDIAEVGGTTDGDIGFELSAGSQDDFWEAFLCGSWSTDMNFLLVKGASVSVTGASEITLAGKDWRDWITVGQHVKLEGFVNAANNGYFHVTVKAFTSGNTVLTVTEASLVVEAGTAYCKLMDASDVILKSTLTAIEALNKINGGGASSFAAATLKVGQKIFMEGLGKETGSISVAIALPAEHDLFKISDSVKEVTFEFASSAALVSPGHVYVNSSASVAPSALADNIVAAVMDQFGKQVFRVSAKKTAGTKETGTYIFTDTPADGATLEISDGRVSVTFELDDNAAVTGANTLVDITGLTTDQIGAALVTAINASALNVTAGYTNGTNTLLITNDNYTGGALTNVNDPGSFIAVANFSAGVAPKVDLTNHRNTGGSITEALASLTNVAFSGGSASKSGALTIAALPDNDSIIVSETLTIDANGGGLTVVIKSSHVRNPGVPTDIVKRSVSGETGFTDVAKYLLHDGLRMGSFKMSMSPGDIVKGSFSFQGGETTDEEATVLGDTGSYTVLESTATSVMNATANFGSLVRDGATLSTAIMKLEMNGEAGLRNQSAVSEKFPAGIGYGRIMLKGSLQAYFQNFDLYRTFRQHDTTSLGWSFEDGDHNKLYFTIPAMKFLSNPLTLEGVDKDVMDNISWQAQRDAVLGTMFMMDRFSSVWPATVA